MASETQAPPATRLMAEALTPEAQKAAIEEAEDIWMDIVEYTYKDFPDTEQGLKDAIAWAKATDVYDEGRVERETLREDWHIYKELYWYEDLARERYDIYEERWVTEV
jgi:hypothetical protein